MVVKQNMEETTFGPYLLYSHLGVHKTE